MDSRFASLRQRDNSVAMLRVKMARRRSNAQKENRERAFNSRRQQMMLPELEGSTMDMSTMSTIMEKTQNAKPAKSEAVAERLKQLERWKERKALEKEKEKRQRERKGVFKTGLYHPQGTFAIVSLPPVAVATGRDKEVKASASQSTRVTRSMRQQQVQKPTKDQAQNTAAKKAAPPVEGRVTRSRAAARPPLAPAPTRAKVCPVEPITRGPVAPVLVPASLEKPTVSKAGRGRGSARTAAPSAGRDGNCKDAVVTSMAVEPEVCPPQPPATKEPEQETCTEDRDVEDIAVDPPAVDSDPSFAPQGFVFQPPSGLPSFPLEPLTPRSADAFLTPSSSFNVAPMAELDPAPERSSPSPSPVQTAAADTEEPKHDVPYFRLQVSSETDRLTRLCGEWEAKVEDESIPEEMRDRMRTAVGQGRLLMKERFHQFSGLVDDCELGRGEKLTTCCDLQGFWEMVYFQVEDVNRKFDALREAEGRGWVEEQKPLPRQRRPAKAKNGPGAATAKPAATNAAAKSRLAAAKAAMKARQQQAQKTSGEGEAEAEADAHRQAPPQSADAVVFDGGFFQVQSPARPQAAPLRRSTRLSAAILPEASPRPTCATPRRRGTRTSMAAALTPAPVAQPAHGPEAAAPNSSLCISPVREAAEDGGHVPEADALADPEEAAPAEGGAHTLPLSPRASPGSASCPVLTLSPCSSSASSPPRCAEGADARMSTGGNAASPAVVDLPGLDFERYLQPSQRGSLSPMETDVEMESPRGADQHVSLAECGSLTPQAEAAADSLLLFTPNIKDQIRQSVCPSDLMVFTPPCSAP